MAQPKTTLSNDGPSAQELEADVSNLERRLREGEELVRRARETGGDRELLERWESHWLKLLRQYELLCDRVERRTNAERGQPSASSGDG